MCCHKLERGITNRGTIGHNGRRNLCLKHKNFILSCYRSMDPRSKSFFHIYIGSRDEEKLKRWSDQLDKYICDRSNVSKYATKGEVPDQYN